jgi:threonine aldolase
MKPPIIVGLTASAIGAVNAAVVARGTSSDQLCAGKSFQENGNWYCQPVHHITYQNVGVKGEYQDVVSMDQQTGACEFKTREFSGPLAPFNEPVSPV